MMDSRKVGFIGEVAVGKSVATVAAEIAVQSGTRRSH